MLGSQRALHGSRQVFLQALHIPLAVEQEHAAVLEVFDHVVLAHIGRVVAGHKVRRADQVRGADRVLAEAQVGLGQAARLLGVVDEIRLTVQIGGVADDLDRVLVRADRAVRAHAPELRAGLALGGGVDLVRQRQRGEGHVVHDADGEVVLRGIGVQIVKDRQDLARGGVLGGQAVAAADDLHRNALFLVDRADILIERLAHRAGLLGAVEDRDALAGLRHGGEEVLGRERAVQVHVDHADLFALRGQVVDGLLGGLRDRAHDDDDVLGIRSAVVVIEMVIAAGELVDLLHVVLDRSRDGGYLFVARLAALEEDIRVDRGAAGGGVLRVERVLAERLERIHIDQRAQILVIERLNLLDLVRGAEAVEEMQHRHAAVDGGQVRDRAQIHDLLRRRGRQQREAGIAHAHNVRMVAEDGQRMCGQGARGDVEHARQHLACDLIHIRDHEEQALRGGVGGGQRAGLQRAVHRAGRAALGLHLDHMHRLAEQVLLPVRRPLVHVFRHRRRRRDREDAGYLGERIRDVRRRLVAVHDCCLFAHTDFPLVLSWVIFVLVCLTRAGWNRCLHGVRSGRSGTAARPDRRPGWLAGGRFLFLAGFIITARQTACLA